jgi:hypothetical protein
MTLVSGTKPYIYIATNIFIILMIKITVGTEKPILKRTDSNKVEAIINIAFIILLAAITRDL